ncbi:MAG: hypothetical protein H6Q70_139 [Firmicutes bacterium]|nr:hypothetical protein [Bacillota bacterium]
MEQIRTVPKAEVHTHSNRECDAVMGQVQRKPDKTVKLGNTTINFFAPPPMDEEELQRRLDRIQEVNWECWNSLTREQKIELNEKYC